MCLSDKELCCTVLIILKYKTLSTFVSGCVLCVYKLHGYWLNVKMSLLHVCYCYVYRMRLTKLHLRIGLLMDML